MLGLPAILARTTVSGVEADKPVLALVGHLNFIHPNQIQVVGVAEAEYLRRLESGELNYDFGELFDIPMSLVIVANGLPVSPKLRDYCHTNSIPLLTSKQESPHLMDVLRIYLQRTLATSTIKHGVFLDVFEVGVLITGQSGLGKSELALELISRGHSLIAMMRSSSSVLARKCWKAVARRCCVISSKYVAWAYSISAIFLARPLSVRKKSSS